MSAGLINKAVIAQKKRQSADYDSNAKCREHSDDDAFLSPFSQESALLDSVRDDPIEVGDEAYNYHESRHNSKLAKIEAKVVKNNQNFLACFPSQYKTSGHA